MFQFFGIEHVKSKNARTHTERESLVKERFIPYKVMFNWSRTFRDGLSLRVSVADEILTKKKLSSNTLTLHELCNLNKYTVVLKQKRGGGHDDGIIQTS